MRVAFGDVPAGGTDRRRGHLLLLVFRCLGRFRGRLFPFGDPGPVLGQLGVGHPPGLPVVRVVRLERHDDLRAGFRVGDGDAAHHDTDAANTYTDTVAVAE